MVQGLVGPKCVLVSLSSNTLRCRSPPFSLIAFRPCSIRWLFIVKTSPGTNLWHTYKGNNRQHYAIYSDTHCVACMCIEIITWNSLFSLTNFPTHLTAS